MEAQAKVVAVEVMGEEVHSPKRVMQVVHSTATLLRQVCLVLQVAQEATVRIVEQMEEESFISIFPEHYGTTEQLLLMERIIKIQQQMLVVVVQVVLFGLTHLTILGPELFLQKEVKPLVQHKRGGQEVGE